MKGTAIFYSLMVCIAFISCSISGSKDENKNEAYDEYEIADPSTKSTEIKVHTIEIRGMKFEPEVLNVKKGDKVVWVNRDFVEHDVTEQNGKAWASSKLKAGVSWDMIVTKSEVYYCNLHVVMKGKIVVDGLDISMLIDPSGITICK
jgi:plastocyanin